MTTMLTRFPFPPGATAEHLRVGFTEVAPVFRQPAGLIRKYFLLSEEEGIAGGVYLWRSRREAEAFEETLRAMIREKLSAEPVITFFETPVIVDNETDGIWTATA